MSTILATLVTGAVTVGCKAAVAGMLGNDVSDSVVGNGADVLTKMANDFLGGKLSKDGRMAEKKIQEQISKNAKVRENEEYLRGEIEHLLNASNVPPEVLCNETETQSYLMRKYKELVSQKLALEERRKIEASKTEDAESDENASNTLINNVNKEIRVFFGQQDVMYEEVEALLRIFVPLMCKAAQQVSGFDRAAIMGLIRKCEERDWDGFRQIIENQIKMLEQQRKLSDENEVIQAGINVISKTTADTAEKVDEIYKKISSGLQPALKSLWLTSVEYTSQISKAVICREDDLQKAMDLLESADPSESMGLLISGMGGIGKTSFAKLLLNWIRDQYEVLAWIPYNGSLKDSISANVRLHQDVANAEERFRLIMNELQNDTRRKLIIIDNADENTALGHHPGTDRLFRELLGLENVTVIVTSRLEALGGYKTLPLPQLDEEACIELFYHYYEEDKKLDPERAHVETVWDIVHRACHHTYTIELLARAARKERSLEVYKQALEQSGFRAPKAYISGTAHDPELEATVRKHLQKLFQMQSRSDTEKQILWDLAVMPVGERFAREELENWLGYTSEEQQRSLYTLERDGWLTNEEERYALHPLVVEIIHLGKERIEDMAPEGTGAYFLEFISDSKNNYFVEGEVYTEKERKIRIAESVLQQVKIEETVQFGSIWHNLADEYENLGEYEKALEYYGKALKIKEEKLGTDHPSTATTYHNMAVVYADMGEYEKALEYYGKALAISEEKLGTDHPSTATTYHNMAVVYADMGEYEKALEYYGKALAIREEKLGTDHPDTATTYNNMAGVYRAQGEYEKALEYYGKALAIREEKLGTDHPDTATTYHNMAGVYEAQGEYEKALEYYGKALAIFEEKLGTDHPSTATTYNNMAGVYEAMGEYEKALEYYGKALAIREEKLGTDHPDTATMYNNMAVLYYYMKQYKDALDYMVKAVRIRTEKFGSNHPWTKSSQKGLKTIYLTLGNPASQFDTWLASQLSEPLDS